MFSDRIVFLAKDLEAASQMRELAGQCNPFHELQTVDAGDAGRVREFLDSLKDGKPDAVFVEVRGFQEIAEVLEPVLAAYPLLPVLVYCRKIDNHAYLELHRLGFGNRILHLPCSRELVEQAMQELRSQREKLFTPPTELCPVLSFFPAKPGSGASTLAWHFAHICAELLGEKTALIDLDLNCGVQSVFAGVRSGMNLFDAIALVNHTGHMPDAHHLVRRGGVEIFSAMGRCRHSRIDSRPYENFLTTVRASYRLVVVDHSGNWERFSVETLKASAVLYCVCESDSVSLSLAGRASSLLAEDGLLPKTRLVLNRNSSRFALSPEEAERLSAMTVAAGLPNCFGEMQKSAGRGYLAGRQTAYFAAVKSLALDTLRLLRLLGEEDAVRAEGDGGARKWLHSFSLGRRSTVSGAAETAARS